MLDQDRLRSRPRRPSRTLVPDRPPPLARTATSVLRALVVQLRPRQWVKNLACLAGLIFSGRLFQLHSQTQALVGFLAFCLASSSVYILNDFLDREKDRLNPRTANRPLASGALPLWLADDLGVSLELEASYEETCRVLRIP